MSHHLPLTCSILPLACMSVFACNGVGAAEDIVQKGCVTDADCPGGRYIDGLQGGLRTSSCASIADYLEGTDTEAVDGGRARLH